MFVTTVIKHFFLEFKIESVFISILPDETGTAILKDCNTHGFKRLLFVIR